MTATSSVTQAWIDFWRNLKSGLRLAFGLSVSLIAFRVSVRQLLLLFCLGVLIGVTNDYVRAGTQPTLSMHAIVYEGFIAATLLLMAVVLSAVFKQPHLKLALPVIVLASDPALGVLNLILALPGNQSGLLGYSLQWAGFWLLVAWIAFIYWRAIATALMPRQPRFWPRSLGGAALLLAGVPLAIWAHQPWFYAAPTAMLQETRYLSPASEAVLVKQPQLLYEAVTELEDERPGVTDLYFVGFAPYSAEDVFRKDIEVARDLFDDRFGTDGRSIVLINNPRTILEAPLATVSNLRLTLSEIGDKIDRKQDVVMLYLTSHGSRDHKLAVEFPPLQLDALAPATLKEMLDTAGIKWRIIVVSACYSGGFIEPLKDDYTLIITASAADRTSFGCGSESEATYFGDALFQHALRFEDSFVKAFEQAKQRIVKRERAEKREASNPQIFVGDEMAAKLPKLEAELRARRSGGAI
ncbi:MAG TPA: C13 family peptidase [Casimicrobiaceae bacterium]|nr:C13 family peptidase [Casimicrobiaceae bacterium]